MPKKEFIETLSEVVMEGLQTDGMVKIKGLGTFKKIDVKARKSVNIRTGESIEIPAHSKITFVAESSLADFVNQPLAHLDTVMLGEVGEVDEEREKTVAEEFKAEVVTAERKVEETEPKEQVAEPEPIDENAEREYGQMDPISRLAEDAASVKMLLEKMNMTPKADAQPLMNAEPTEKEEVEERVEEKVAEPAPIAEEPKVEEVQQVVEVKPVQPVVEEKVQPVVEEKPVQPEPVVEEKKPKSKKKKGGYWWILIVLIIAALLGYGTYYVLTHFLGGEKEEAEPEIVEEIETPESVLEETEVAQEPEETIVEEANVFEQERNYTEYIDTVTVGQDSRLTMISLRAYGSKAFWVYIYEANQDKIKDPGKICAGMKLRIPKIDPRLVDANSEEALNYAKELEKKYVK